MTQERNIRHKLANPKGGLNMLDEGGIMPAAIKEVATKIANNLIRLNFSDLLVTSAPSIMHCDKTYIECTA